MTDHNAYHKIIHQCNTHTRGDGIKGLNFYKQEENTENI